MYSHKYKDNEVDGWSQSGERRDEEISKAARGSVQRTLEKREVINQTLQSSESEEIVEFDDDDDHEMQREYILHKAAMRDLKRQHGDKFWQYKSSKQVAKSHARAAADGYFNQ